MKKFKDKNDIPTFSIFGVKVRTGKHIKILCIFIFISLSFQDIFCQSLSPERIVKIKNCSVRITIDGETSGTGFFINKTGQILTCWHVVESAIIKDSLQQIIGFKNIGIILNNGEKRTVGISTYFLQNGNKEAVGYDFCLLNQLKPGSFPFFKIGDYNIVSEGDDIYTCGFPMGLEQPFISKGMISTKFVDTLNSINYNGKNIIMPRTQALLDLTLNGGNSGGAIVKMGKTIDDDEVIGLADFVINPIGSTRANDMIRQFSHGVNKYSIEGVDPSKVFIYFTQVMSKMSLGVSGCISTNHFLNALSNIKN